VAAGWTVEFQVRPPSLPVLLRARWALLRIVAAAESLVAPSVLADPLAGPDLRAARVWAGEGLALGLRKERVRFSARRRAPLSVQVARYRANCNANYGT
jgi:hypothetical protein